MMDVLAAKGSVEIMYFLRSVNKPITIPDINQFFNSDNSKERLTTATIYRRVKELQLVGMITKNQANKVVLTDYGLKCLMEMQKEEIKLKKYHRGVLYAIQQKKIVTLEEIRNSGYSPVTILNSVKDLERLDLVEKNLEEKTREEQKKVGRPKKKFKLTKKGQNYLKIKERLEEDQGK